jgi:hypothetical protein
MRGRLSDQEEGLYKQAFFIARLSRRTDVSATAVKFLLHKALLLPERHLGWLALRQVPSGTPNRDLLRPLGGCSWQGCDCRCDVLLTWL